MKLVDIFENIKGKVHRVNDSSDIPWNVKELTFIGQGSTADVYLFPGDANKVIKHVHRGNPVGQNILISILRSSGNNPFFPIVYDAYSVGDSLIYSMERLEPLPMNGLIPLLQSQTGITPTLTAYYYLFDELDNQRQKNGWSDEEFKAEMKIRIKGLYEHISKDQAFRQFMEEGSTQRIQDLLKHSNNSDFKNAIESLLRAKSRANIDLINHDNIMLRGKQLVLVDPLI